MKTFLFLGVFSFLAAGSFAAQAADPAEGLWLTQNKRSVIEIKPCEKGLCGHVYWIIEGGMQFDEKNPDPAQHVKPMCGLPILWGFTQQGPGAWEDGKIYKADDGDIYDADMEIKRDGTLKVHGYVGIPLLGKTQIWTRAEAKDYPECKPAK